MSEQLPSLEVWKKLYELMAKIKELSPWTWMGEDDIFAVEDLETKEIDFVSVMGAIGEHYSITRYRGEEGLSQFWALHTGDFATDDQTFQKILEIPQFQASFEERKFLQKEDRKIIKELGLTYQGNNAWPMFRSFQPGFAPWFIDSSAARILINALEQTIDISLQFRDDPDVLTPDDKGGYLLRPCIKKGNKIKWQDSIWYESTAPPSEPIEFLADDIAFKKIESLLQKGTSFEMDILMSLTPIQEKGEKPYYPYILLFVDINTEMIVAFELIQPLPNLSAMGQKLPSIIANNYLKISFIPRQIYVTSENLYQSLVYLNDYVNLSVKHVKRLKVASKIRKSFTNFNKM